MFDLKTFLASGANHVDVYEPIDALASTPAFRPRTVGEKVTIGDVIVFQSFQTERCCVERVMNWRDMLLTPHVIEMHGPLAVLAPV